jgi:hypothetical protein
MLKMRDVQQEVQLPLVSYTQLAIDEIHQRHMPFPCAAHGPRLESRIRVYAAAYNCNHVETSLLPAKEHFSRIVGFCFACRVACLLTFCRLRPDPTES